MIARPNLIKDLGRLFFWFPIRWFICAAPFAFSYWLGGMVGRIDYFISGRQRTSRMLRNVKQVLPIEHQAAKNIILHNLQNHSRNILELMKYPSLRGDDIASLVSYHGFEHVQEALRRGKGVLLMTAHLGAKQFLQIALGAEKKLAINQINFHMDKDELTWGQQIAQKKRMQIEEQIPARFIAAKGFLRSAFKCLKNNEILIVAGDGVGLRVHMDKSYKPYSFLDKKMLFPTNSVMMAQRTGACLIPVFVIREKVGHRIVFEPPIETAQQDGADPLGDYVSILEKYIRQYPELWEFWEEFDEENLVDGGH